MTAYQEYPKHLGRLVARAFLAHPGPISTSVLLDWAYGPERKPWHRPNLHRHLRTWGIQSVGISKSKSHALLWQLRRIEDIDPPSEPEICK
jgi:hypothetical protein